MIHVGFEGHGCDVVHRSVKVGIDEVCEMALCGADHGNAGMLVLGVVSGSQGGLRGLGSATGSRQLSAGKFIRRRLSAVVINVWTLFLAA